MAKTLEMEVLVADGTDGDGIDVHPSSSKVPKDLTPRARPLLVSFGLFLVCAVMYVWIGEIAGDEVIADMYTKPPDAIADPETNKYAVENNNNKVDSNVTEETGFHEGVLNSSSVISINGIPDDVVEALSLPDIPVTGGGECSALCDSRDEARKKKFGGDLLDLSDVLRLAEKGRDKLHARLKVDYGDDFEAIFIKEPGKTPPSYQGMEPITEDGLSRDRLKRKLQIKVLKMMESLKISDESVHGCNCVTRTGSPAENEESFSADIPDYYQQYVFANGGHSNAAGHGNTFSQTYTAYLGEDLRFVWDAIGVEMIDRNMAMGGQRSAPDIAACSKEIFGTDVDFLTWNYAMTDKSPESFLYYVYRGATSPGRPAFVAIDYPGWRHHGPALVRNGLSIFQLMINNVPGLKNVPDSSPDGVSLPDAKMNQLAPFAKHLLCNGRIESGVCGDNKWKCTKDKLPCDCPTVGKRNGWHAGYKVHALTGHFLALPVVEMLLEGISDLVSMDKDPEAILQELQKQEEVDYETFLAFPIFDTLNDIVKKSKIGQALQNRFMIPLGDEFDNWFKGPSICRTGVLPSMTRYLGLATNSDKVGGSARCGEETYETGIPFDRTPDHKYTYTTNRTPPPGEFSIMAPNDQRSCHDDCSEIVMPDYKDWFYGNWSSGSASLTFPNEKEKEYYGYDPAKFKGILALMPTIYPERIGKREKTRWVSMPLANYSKNVALTVNGQPVRKYRKVDGLVILEGPNGMYWKPSSNNDYVLEFKPRGVMDDGVKAIEKRIRLQAFVLM
mmetsp:Transcript_6423/g.15175  ORF Transcript_6423/g.15175 Transcript_6423/m.15175 type:complete len:785 (+) Transcript_6423:207-2561(+)